jgi:transcriptional regulator with XRE-family HTH domain
MDMRKLVGRNTKKIRLVKRLTQEELAERSGFSQQYISDLERGRRNPTVVSLYELAQALGVDYLDLLQPDKR